MKLKVCAFALACAIIWGLGLFVITWWIMLTSGEQPDFVPFIGRIYLGYRITPLGSIIGLVWAFVDGLVGGAIFAWLYNMFAARCKCKEEVATPPTS